jgi:hypothetical protein
MSWVLLRVAGRTFTNLPLTYTTEIIFQSHGDEMRALRRLQRESPASPFLFVSERGSPFTPAPVSSVAGSLFDGPLPRPVPRTNASTR